mmetsp:Transcript_4145/g.8888  ORF Transcript_4145/g.8888 Transcript_4145/m.8888 type:complete len:133 (-) Transcript_4145:848-1246(-)
MHTAYFCLLHAHSTFGAAVGKRPPRSKRDTAGVAVPAAASCSSQNKQRKKSLHGDAARKKRARKYGSLAEPGRRITFTLRADPIEIRWRSGRDRQAGSCARSFDVSRGQRKQTATPQATPQFPKKPPKGEPT